MRHSVSVFVIGGLLWLGWLAGCADYDTLGLQDPPTPVNVWVEETTDSSVTVAWSRCHDDDFAQYAVYYDTSDIVDTTSSLADTLCFPQDTVKTVRSLDARTQYYFRVIVRDLEGLVSPSNIADTMTLVDIAESLHLYEPDSITDTSVFLRWSPSRLGDVHEYRVYRDSSSSADSSDTLVGRIHDDTTMSIDDLERSRMYYFRVYAEDENGTIIESNERSITTLSGLPDTATLRHEEIVDTAVTLRWTKSVADDFERYIVHYDTVDTIDSLSTFDTSLVNTTAFRDVEDTVFTVSTLAPSTRYYFVVYVQDKGELWSVSNIDSVTTDDGIPDTVVLSLGPFTDTSVTLSWTQSVDTQFVRYNVRMDTTETIDTADTVVATLSSAGDTVATVTGLRERTKYWFAVSVENVTGRESLSNVVVNYPIVLRVGSSTDTTVTLRWTRAESDAFDAYRLYRDTEPDVTDHDYSLEVNPIENSHIESYRDTTIVSGETYYYRLFLYEGGSTEGRACNEVKFVVP